MWKSKARKLILQSMKNKLDESKLTQCVLEGNSLPFSSRLKDILKNLMPKKAETSSTSQSSSSAVAVGGVELGSRKSVKPAVAALLGSSSSKLREVPDSSDEERTFVARQSGQAAAIASGAAPVSSFRQGCTFDPTILADECLIKWPVPLSTAQKALNVEMTAQVMKAHGHGAEGGAAATASTSSSSAPSTKKESDSDAKESKAEELDEVSETQKEQQQQKDEEEAMDEEE